MNNSTYINFKKERELGEIISDTFAFIKQNYKVLFEVFLKVLWPVLLVMLLAITYYTYVSLNISENIMVGANSNMILESFSDFYSGIFVGFVVLILASWFYYSLMYGAYQHAIESYIKNEGTINIDEVLQGVKQNWASFLGLSFLSWLLILIGFFICILPGIYVSVPFSMLFSILVFNKLGVSESISYSFSLIKGNWWTTFFTFFVISLIYGLIGFVFDLPAVIYSLFKGFVAGDSGTLADPDFMFDWIYLTLNILGSLAKYLLYPIVIIGTIFMFFNLNEKKNQTGTYETIESLGNNK
ncbi:hypothetical protein [Mesonia aquimarina]|uniref:hypothetical protein n=1 Tax=Mesonia aquimarina TaxID=1504967 RepID=UPI000EF5BA4C|nr:hypothetical protein [Mesonia aquimarina]